MSDEIVESLKCGICLDYCNDPMETNCCHKLYCNICISRLEDKCPTCRKKCSYSRSVIAQRMINMLPIECSFCNIEFTRDQIENHKFNCPKAKTLCPLCKTEFFNKNMLNHFLNEHDEECRKKLEKIINLFDDEKNKTNQQTIDELENSRNFIAKLGSSGKYYCGERLDGDRCTCCNGFCGPIEGCNCSACMELDVKSRKLPKGWLVNSDGYASRRSGGKFYCGRFILFNLPYCDGYCGPYDGPNCNSCHKLDIMTRSLTSRYRNLI